MSPATRAHRPTPAPEPPAVAILNAAAAVAEVRGAYADTLNQQDA